MSSPIKNMFHKLESYIVPISALPAGLVTINALAKSYNICTSSGSLNFIAVPQAINSLLPGKSCISATGTAAVWLATTALTTYGLYKVQQKSSNKEELKSVNIAEAKEQRSPQAEESSQSRKNPMLHPSGYFLRSTVRQIRTPA